MADKERTLPPKHRTAKGAQRLRDLTSVAAELFLERGFDAQAKSLREFGYPDVTAEMVAAAHAKWLAGEETGDIVSMFCVSAFEEHPEIFGERVS